MTATDIESSTHPAVSQPVQRALTAIEGEAYAASAELVYVREHHDEYDRLDPHHDILLDSLIRAGLEGDVRQVRALAPQVIAANRELDQIVEAARVRVPAAHTHTKRIASTVETVLTGRTS